MKHSVSESVSETRSEPHKQHFLIYLLPFLSIVMSKADRPFKCQCFNESFNYIIDKQLFEVVWDES